MQTETELAGAEPVHDIHVEFDNRQLTIRSDVPGVLDYVRENFAHMVVPAATSPAATLEVTRTDAGYRVSSAESIEYRDPRVDFLLPVVKDEVRLQFIRSRPDLLWLHAAAVERGGGALLLSGASGQGKSTLSTRLCERGWKLLSDDIAPVRMDADEVLAFPQTPVRRIHPGREVAPDEVRRIEREAVSVVSGSLRREPAPIRAIVFIAYADSGPTAITRLLSGSAALEILRNSTNFVDHKSAAVARAAAMARSVPMFLLSYSSAADAADVLDGLL